MLSAIRFGLRCAAVLFAVLLALPVAAQAHKSRGYSHDEGAKTTNVGWMTALKDTVLLSELSIPGTHDTMARTGTEIAEAQTMTLQQQLDSGIRLIDIRCWHVNNEFQISHGPIYQGTNFDYVLKTVIGFLVDHPGETVVMRMKEESKSTAINNHGSSFEETFASRYWKNYKDYFYQGTSNPSNNPPLSDMRGKIVMLQKFSDNKTYGIRYSESNGFNVQDKYTLWGQPELYDKWTLVKAQLKQANDGDTNVKFVNFLSASGGVLPYFVASGHTDARTSAPRLATGRTAPGWNGWKDFPRVSCYIGICTIAYEGTNVLTYERLGDDYKKRVGLLFADFPGPGLIERTIKLNDRFKK